MPGLLLGGAGVGKGRERSIWTTAGGVPLYLLTHKSVARKMSARES